MSQNSLILPTTGTVSGLQMTNYTNAAIDTLNTNSSGASAPGSPEAGQFWHDTTNNILKLRSLDNTTWISLFTLDESGYLAMLTNLAGLRSGSTIATPSQGDSSTKIINSQFFGQNLPGGYVNKFRNAAFDIWQRGLSRTVTAGSGYAYTADGWMVSCTGANISWAQIANSGIGAPFYALRLTGNTGNTNITVTQRIESLLAATLTGQPVTFQMAFNNTTGGTVTPSLSVNYANAQDNFGSTTSIISNVTLQPVANSTDGVISYTFNAGANAYNGLEVVVNFGNNFGSGSAHIALINADIRATPGLSTGLNSSPPPAELRNVQVEFALCQRYYQIINQIAATIISSTTINMYGRLAVPMFAAPTAVATGPLALVWSGSTATQSSSSVGTVFSTNTPYPDYILFLAAGNFSGLTSGQAGSCPTAVNNSNFITLSAEL